MTQRTSDEPLVNPEQDLLGLATHAQRLAAMVRTVPTPFTVGIQGDWGAGKTTFVNFLEHYLQHPEDPRQPAGDATVAVEFIAFDAWLYKSADELWRALVLDIARKLYGVEKDKAPLKVPPRSKTIAWRDVLARDAIVLRGSAEPRTAQAEFEDLAAFLDQAMYGGIGKTGSTALRLDQEDAVLAAVRAGATALGAISPLVGGLRTLLGIGGDAEAAQRADREKNQATRNRIESIARFERLFAQIVLDKGYFGGTGKRLCIFVDNLDRCTPDVALDLLDAVKIFLKNAQFVFVVAADERLIGEGLKIRYKDASQGDLASKGQEYIEKIVQLRIHIPECTEYHIHRFVAAQFPEWMPATDIIYRAVGSNPRRLKQYCSWLFFRYGVDRTEDPADERIQLLEKLIALRWRDEACLDGIAALARGPEYERKMGDLERSVWQLGEDASDQAIAALVDREDVRVLCKQITGSHPLYCLVTASKRFSEFPAMEVATLASIADLRPHPELMLEASDRVFMRILRQLSTGTAVIEKLLLEDLTRLQSLHANEPQVLAHTEALARACPDTAEWSRQMSSVERSVQSGQLAADALPEAVALHQKVFELSPSSPEPTGAAARLLESPRLSEMLRDEVVAYCDVRGELPEVGGLLDEDIYANVSDVESARRLARTALDKLPAATRERLKDALRLRQWAATRCIQLRGFVKLNAIDRRWPVLGRRLRTDFAAIRWLEKQALESLTVPAPYAALWEEHGRDEELLRFLALRPLFGDIDPSLLQKYHAVSQIVASTAESAAAAAAAPVVHAAWAEALPEPASPEYINVTLTLSAVPAGADPPDHVGMEYEVHLEESGMPRVVERITLDWSEMDNALRMFQELAQLNSGTPVLARGGAGSLRQVSGVVPLSQEGDFQSQLKAIGGKVYDAIIRGHIRVSVERLLSSARPYRFLVTLPSALMMLPLETMYSANQRMFLALSQRYSLVRFIAGSTPPPRAAVKLPLRVLAVLSNPPNTAPLNIDGEAEVLERALASAQESKRASLELLRGPEATLEHLQQRLRKFRPHVLHFVGHGVFDSATSEGSLIFHGPTGKAHTAGASHVATLLRDAHVRIAVLNGCDTGRSARNDGISSVAGSLVHAGVPAVIATMRQVWDESALLFARDFYRTFCEGFAMETAIAEARKALSVQRGDWSVYALFASTPQLDRVSIPSAGPSRQAAAV